MPPVVSVIIPTYNRASFLVAAIETAVTQTVAPAEIIVVDDGSTDNTKEAIARYGSKVRYILQANSGPAAARNRGIRAATGDFVALLDSDDLWVPDRIERQARALERYPQLDLICGLETKFDADRESTTHEIQNEEVWQTLCAADCVVPQPLGVLMRENFVPTSTVLFRRSCIKAVGYFDESLHHAEDYDLWLRFARQGFQFGFLNATLCRRRQHAGNLVRQWYALTAATAEVLTRHHDACPMLREHITHRLDELNYDLGSWLFHERKFAQALPYLRRTRPVGAARLSWMLKIASAWLFAGSR